MSSTIKIINDIIENYNCPFTESEVCGFFTGLVLSKIDKKDLENKILSFMDIDSESLNNSHQLLSSIRNDIESKEFVIINQEKKDFSSTSSSLAEWTYYFLISFQTPDSTESTDPKLHEILDVFDEISMLNQKYTLDNDDNATKESLDDINSFIVKSVQYIFNKNND